MRRRNKPAISRADSAKTELCEWNGKGNGIPNLVKPFELSICIWSWLCNRNETFYGCTDNVEKLFFTLCPSRRQREFETKTKRDEKK